MRDERPVQARRKHNKLYYWLAPRTPPLVTLVSQSASPLSKHYIKHYNRILTFTLYKRQQDFA